MDEEFSCRICLEPSQRQEVIAPCNCKGSAKWVHRACLDRWRVTREDKAFSRCTECLKEYTLISVSDDTPAHRRQRQCEYAFYVIRDIGGALIGVQVIIVLFSAFVYVSDEKSSALVTAFHMVKHKMEFYYFAGLALLLSIAGLIFMLQLLSGGRCCDGASNTCCDTYLLTTTDLTPCPCRHAFLCCDARVAPICDCGPCCAECGAACSDCSALSAGGEVALILFVLLALIGLVVAVFAGMLFAQQVIQKHLHIIEKRGLAKDYIVADLEEVSDDIESRKIPDDFPLDGIVLNPLRSQAIYRGTNRSVEPSAPSYDLLDTSERGSISSTQSYTNQTSSSSNLTAAQQRLLASRGLI